MKKLPFLLALMASHIPSSMLPKACRPKPLSNQVADMTAITKAKQKRARRAEKLAAKETPK